MSEMRRKEFTSHKWQNALHGLTGTKSTVTHLPGQELCSRSVKWYVHGLDARFGKIYVCLAWSKTERFAKLNADCKTTFHSEKQNYHNLLSYFVPSEAGKTLWTFSTSIFVYLSAKLIKLPLPFILCYHAYVVEKSKTPPHKQNWDFYCNQ